MQFPHRVDGVGVFGLLVLPISYHAREAQCQTTRIMRAVLQAVECDLDDELGTHVDVIPSRWVSIACSCLVCQPSRPSVNPLNVLPSITKPPVSGSRAPRCRLESLPCRRPWPHSAARTTRSSVLACFTFIQFPPLLPASYAPPRALAISPS